MSLWNEAGPSWIRVLQTSCSKPCSGDLRFRVTQYCDSTSSSVPVSSLYYFRNRFVQQSSSMQTHWCFRTFMGHESGGIRLIYGDWGHFAVVFLHWWFFPRVPGHAKLYLSAFYSSNMQWAWVTPLFGALRHVHWRRSFQKIHYQRLFSSCASFTFVTHGRQYLAGTIILPF